MIKIIILDKGELNIMKYRKLVEHKKINGILAIMKIKRVIIPTITMVIIASQLFGCSSASKQEAYDMLQETEEIELEYAVPETVDQEQIASLDWIELGSLTTYSSLRAEWDNILGVTGTTGNKEGIFYMGYSGPTQDSFLAQVIQLQAFVDEASNESTYNALVDAVRNNFVDSDDLTDDQLFSIGLNAYFNLLPMKDESETYANEYVSRAQFLSLITRATNPASVQDTDEFKTNANGLNNQIGDSIYNESVALSLSYSYLTLEDGSLNSDTYNSSISRGEAIYTIMQMIYGEDELSTVDLDSTTFTDTTNGGDLATKNNLTSKAQVIQYAIQHPDQGCPEDIYRALVKLNELGLIGSETAWDEAITLSDTITLYYDIATSRFASTSTSSNSTTASSNDKIVESESWPEYKETMDYYVAQGLLNESEAYLLNPDIYGTETAGKSTQDFPIPDGKPVSSYILRLVTTTTKGFEIEAYWYKETNTVTYVYSGEVSPYGAWFIDMDSDDAIEAAGGNRNMLSNTHQQKIDILGEPSLSPEEVIEYLSVNGMTP